MKKLLILLITFTFATELEVDGTLKVTGGIDAQGQTITNVGNPVNANDAIPMSAVSGVVTNAMSLSGINPPERIYRYEGIYGETKGLVVPNGKMWLISSLIPPYSSGVEINFSADTDLSLAINKSNGSSSTSIYMLSGDAFNISFGYGAIINIFEYSITSSGTSQGMDYVEP